MIVSVIALSFRLINIIYGLAMIKFGLVHSKCDVDMLKSYVGCGAHSNNLDGIVHVMLIRFCASVWCPVTNVQDPHFMQTKLTIKVSRTIFAFVI